jgi:hypothetical protein
MGMAKKYSEARPSRAGAAALVLLLATATSCTTSSHVDSGNNIETHGASEAGTATPTAQPKKRGVDAEAVEVMGTGGMLVAGRLPHGQRTQIWHCAALSDISQCQDVGPPALSRSDYIDDMASFGRNTYWVLTMNPDRQRSSIHITTNGGRSWVQHAVPSHGLAAGSQGTIQVFGERQALLTQYTANGPVAQQYRTDDAGAAWQRVGEINLN